MKTKLIRVKIELADEIKEIARKNQITLTEASKEIARLLRNNKNRKIKREITF